MSGRASGGGGAAAARHTPCDTCCGASDSRPGGTTLGSAGRRSPRRLPKGHASVAALLDPEPPLTGTRAALLRREQRGRTFVGLVVAAAVLALASSWSGGPSDAFWFWVGACFAAELL